MFLVTDKALGLDISLDLPRHSLTDTQAMAIEQALQDGWSIDRHVSCDESLALLVSRIGDGAEETMLYVDADAHGFNLSVMRDDDLQFRGCYGSVDALLSSIRSTS